MTVTAGMMASKKQVIWCSSWSGTFVPVNQGAAREIHPLHLGLQELGGLQACLLEPTPERLGTVGPLGEEAAFQLVENAFGGGYSDRDDLVEVLPGKDGLPLLGPQLPSVAVLLQGGQLCVEAVLVGHDMVVLNPGATQVAGDHAEMVGMDLLDGQDDTLLFLPDEIAVK